MKKTPIKHEIILDKNDHKNFIVSYGIVLFDRSIYDTNIPKILIVTRADSYAFSSLIVGRLYRPIDKIFVESLTFTEQQNIINNNVNFEALYRRANQEKFVEKSEKVIKTIIKDRKPVFYNNLNKIKQILQTEQCSNSYLPISVPKGRQEHDQSMETIVKDELFQECKILYDNVKITKGTIDIVYTDYATQYVFKLLVGIMANDTQPIFDPNDSVQSSEISAVNWHSEESIKLVQTDPISKKVYVNNFKTILDMGLDILQHYNLI